MFSTAWSPPAKSDYENNEEIKGGQSLVSKGIRLPVKGILNHGIIKESCDYNGRSFKEKVAESLFNNPSMSEDAYEFLYNETHDFKEFQNRSSIIPKSGELYSVLQEFVYEKGSRIFKTNARQINKTYSNFNWKCFASLDKYKYLPPLEYFLNVGPEISEKQFLKSICTGDILFGKVIEYQENDTHILQIIATGGFHHRNLIGTNVKAELKWENLMPQDQDVSLSDNLNVKRKMYEIKTLLTVEVLHTSNIVEGNLSPGEMVCVGTKGVALQKLYYDDVDKRNFKPNKLVLGKIDIVNNSNTVPLILKSIERKEVHSYNECLMEFKLNLHSKSKHLKICKCLNFEGDFRHSLMNSIHNSSFAWYEPESLRVVQNRKWAEEAFDKQWLHESKDHFTAEVEPLKDESISSTTLKTENAKMTPIANIIINHAKYHNKLNQYNDALRGLDLDSNNHETKESMSFEIILQYARERESTKNFREAVKVYNKCLEFNPENKEAKESIDRLKHLNSEEGKDQNIEEVEKLLDYREGMVIFHKYKHKTVKKRWPTLDEWKTESTCWFYNFPKFGCMKGASSCPKQHYCSYCDNTDHGQKNCPQLKSTVVFVRYERSTKKRNILEEDLIECFSQFGMLVDCKKNKGHSGSVEFLTGDAAEKAIKESGKLHIHGNILQIKSDGDKDIDIDIPPHLKELLDSGVIEEAPMKMGKEMFRCTICNVSCNVYNMDVHLGSSRHKCLVNASLVTLQSSLTASTKDVHQTTAASVSAFSDQNWEYKISVKSKFDNVTEDDMRKCFSQFGKVVACDLRLCKKKRDSFCMIEFETGSAPFNAEKQSNILTCKGNKLKIRTIIKEGQAELLGNQENFSHENYSGTKTVPNAPQDRFSRANTAPHAPQERFSGANTAPHAPQERFSGANTAPHAPQERFSAANTVPHAPQERFSTANTAPNAPQEKFSGANAAPHTPQERFSGANTAPDAPQKFSGANTAPLAPKDSMVALQPGLAASTEDTEQTVLTEEVITPAEVPTMPTVNTPQDQGLIDGAASVSAALRHSEYNEISSIFIKTFNFDNITEDDLRKCFSRFGKVVTCHVVRKNKRKDSYGFVEFEHSDAAENAVRQTHKVDIKGNVLRIKTATLGEKPFCYFETQPGGCKKNNCMFKHEQDSYDQNRENMNEKDESIVCDSSLNEGNALNTSARTQQGIKLFVRSKSLANIKEKDLRKCFGQFGKVGYCNIPKLPDGSNRNFCFVVLKNEEAADMAVKQTNLSIKGNVLQIEKKTEDKDIAPVTVPCWHFNNCPDGCTYEAAHCKKLHICSHCHQKDHPKLSCPLFEGSDVAKVAICSECAQHGHDRLNCPELRETQVYLLRNVLPTLGEWRGESTCWFYNFSTIPCRSGASGCKKQHACSNCHQESHPNITCSSLLPGGQGATSKEAPSMDEWEYEKSCWFFNFGIKGCNADGGCKQLHICSECHESGHSHRDCPVEIKDVAEPMEVDGASADSMLANKDREDEIPPYLQAIFNRGILLEKKKSYANRRILCTVCKISLKFNEIDSHLADNTHKDNIFERINRLMAALKSGGTASTKEVQTSSPKNLPTQDISNSATSAKQTELETSQGEFPRDSLQILLQMMKGGDINFAETVICSDPDDPEFVCDIEIRGQKFRGIGKSEKEAKLQAAEVAVQALIKSTKIFVKSTSFAKTTEEDIKEFFSQYGKVVDVIITKKKKNKYNNFCFVDFENSREANEVANLPGQLYIKGNLLKITKMEDQDGANDGYEYGSDSRANAVPLGPQKRFSGSNTAPLAPQGKFSGANTTPIAPRGKFYEANTAPLASQRMCSGTNTVPHAPQEKFSGANSTPDYLIYGRRGVIESNTFKSQHIRPSPSNESMSGPIQSGEIEQDLSSDVSNSLNLSSEMVSEIKNLLSTMSGEKKKIWEKRFNDHVAEMEREVEKAFADDKPCTRSIDDRSDDHVKKMDQEIEKGFANDKPSAGSKKDNIYANSNLEENRKRKIINEEQKELDMEFFIGTKSFDHPENKSSSSIRDSGTKHGSKRQKLLLEDEDLCDKSKYNLLVRGLSIDRTKEEVVQLFSNYGVINDVHLEWSENPAFTGEQTAYVEFKRTDDVILLLNQNQNLYIKDNLISIQMYVDPSKSNNTVIFVSGFTHVNNDTKRDLIDYFNKFSSVRTLFLNTNSEQFHYAFVAFQSKEAVKKIVSHKEPYIFQKNVLKLEEVKVLQEEKDLEKLEMTQQSVSVPANKFSPKIKQSVNILKEIMSETGATYEFVLNHHTSINQMLTVHGTPEQIFSAKKLINENLRMQMSRKLKEKDAEKDAPKILIITENIFEVLESICLKEVDLELDTCVRILENITLPKLCQNVSMILNEMINVRYVIFVFGIQDFTKNVNTSKGVFNVPIEEIVLMNELFIKQQQEVSERLHNQFHGVQFLWTTPIPYCFEKYSRLQMSTTKCESPHVIPSWCWTKIQKNFNKCLFNLRMKMLESDPHCTIDFQKLFINSNSVGDGLRAEKAFLDGDVPAENWFNQDCNMKFNAEGGRALRYCIRKAVQRQILWGSDSEIKSEWQNYLREILYREQQERVHRKRDLKLISLPKVEEIIEIYGVPV